MQTNKRLLYLNRLIEKISSRLDEINALDRKFSMYRLAVFVTGLAGAFILFFIFGSTAFLIAFAVTVLSFILLASIHTRIRNYSELFASYLEVQKQHRARIELNWSRLPQEKNAADLPFTTLSRDVNLTGEHSLIRLIDQSTTEIGFKKLYQFLTGEHTFSEILKRQRLTRELENLGSFRDRLYLKASIVRKKFNYEALIKWLEKESRTNKVKKRLFLLLLLLPLNYFVAISAIFGLVNLPYTALVTIYIAVFFIFLKDLEPLIKKSVMLANELSKVSEVFGHIEKFKFRKGSELEKLTASLKEKKHSASHSLGEIRKCVENLEYRKNPLLWIIVNIVFPWDYYQLYKIEKYRNIITGSFRGWMDIWFTIEALNSLALPGWLFPDYSYPAINEKSESLSMKSAGHPLIPENEIVRNDFEIGSDTSIFLITGSNMSGKSTFLRTTGINLALAYAGARVNAASMKTGLFTLYSCINVTDSVTDGISYFYAEVKRLKGLLEAVDKSSERRVFYLIDEIFRGTNNRERLIGSLSLIKALAESDASGMISTHDLELIKLSDEISSLKNFHFKESTEGRRMVFDYKLHPGPSPTTNALKIMQMEGLPVDKDISNQS